MITVSSCRSRSESHRVCSEQKGTNPRYCSSAGCLSLADHIQELGELREHQRLRFGLSLLVQQPDQLLQMSKDIKSQSPVTISLSSACAGPNWSVLQASWTPFRAQKWDNWGKDNTACSTQDFRCAKASLEVCGVSKVIAVFLRW